ncbi:hypothetical protein [Parasynechococcus sp.]|uniref:hypothetical protein n=1 Tax=Parasynechococcus sp. TaxID=3101203 RepID=UPI003704BECC
MEEPKTTSIRIEPLNPAHLAQWVQDAPLDQLSRFQGFLIGEWLSRVEQRFPDLLPSRSPRCLMALAGDRPVASVVARPFNRRGSCWILHLPELLGAVDGHSHRTIQQSLLQQALQSWTAQICSWVIRCPATDADAIALLRELGFQPLRPYQCWCPPRAEVEPPSSDQLPAGLRWAALNRRTAGMLWPIEQGGSHSHLRQITDRHWLDLLDRNGPSCGVLMAGEAVLAGCIRLPDAGEAGFLELMRDVAWDPRLDQALPQVLNGILQRRRPRGLLTALDDAPLSRILEAEGWTRGDEQLLLGRSMLRRQSPQRNLQLTRSLDQVLGRLRPQGTPLPTPSLGDRH